MSKPIYYEGQQVGCLMYGEGNVNRVLENDRISVKTADGLIFYKANGSIDTTIESRPTLYPIDQYREIIANLPSPQPEAWNPKPGEWCWFWHLESEKFAILDKFERMDGYNYMNVSDYTYKHCAPFTGELPDHLKELQP